ncbi:hypothetical protein CFE70_006536 [Pyrenophora teres f. teres 0-1]
MRLPHVMSDITGTGPFEFSVYISAGTCQLCPNSQDVSDSAIDKHLWPFLIGFFPGLHNNYKRDAVDIA